MKHTLVAAFSVAILWASAPSASAQSADQATATPESLERVYACASETDPARRLACYDTAVPALRTAQTGGQIVALDRGNVERLQRDSFGFNVPSIANLIPQIGHGNDVVARVEATVERLSVGPSGRTTFYFADGQVWTQVDPDRVYNVRAGDTVTIRRASLGSFMISSPRGGSGIRVRRSE